MLEDDNITEIADKKYSFLFKNGKKEYFARIKLSYFLRIMVFSM